jgi:hypothetical protein
LAIVFSPLETTTLSDTIHLKIYHNSERLTMSSAEKETPGPGIIPEVLKKVLAFAGVL